MNSQVWEAMVEQYGQRVTLRRGEEDKECKAFFQPVRENKPGELPSPLGAGPEGLYLYLGPAGEELENVGEILWQGKAFEILRHRAVPVGEETFYRWAVCREWDEVRP